jgi:diguanylate cyclase (GGDEF)-like protein
VAADTLVHARLVEDARSRVTSRLYGRDQLATIALSLGFLVTAISLVGLLPAAPLPSATVLAALVLCHGLMSRVEFELGSGSVLPTQLVLVPMLFLAPPALVPLLVAVGFVGSGLPDLVRGRVHVQRVFVFLLYSWHSVGPALVFGLLQPGAPSWSDWPVYLLALAAQFAFDLASAVGREWLGLDVSPRILLPVLGRAYLVDALLAPIGFLAALATVDEPLAFLPVVSLGALLAFLASDRRDRIGETIQLTDAFTTATTAARADALTGLANRRSWEEQVAAVEHARRDRPEPVSVILVDLDGLKLANDTRGHAFGDELLRAAASVIAACLDEDALVARLGGDEFGILLRGVDEAGCDALVERLEEAIATHPGRDGFPLAASIGAASSPPATAIVAAIEVADERMYRRKRRARLSRVRLDGNDAAAG